MSQRVKKPGRPDESQGKRRRRRPTGSDADEDGTRSGSNSGGNGSLSGGVWTPRNLGDLKVASIYNRNSAEAPAEVTSLYRKDLISAMKLPDSEPLLPEEYWLITDPWKQEWEKGVQVPVNPESLPESQVVVISPVADRSHDFRLPKKKYVRVTHDDFFNPDYHQLVSTAARAEKVCSYDLDDVDAAWLGCANSDRVMLTLPVISEFLMEQVIEELELQCWEQVQTILKSQEGLGIEYDENVICDVCRSPESEEGNEMVFCDSCNICVHQACYGITSIPSGSFLCRTCALGIRPSCILCPNMGGAMKATRSGHKWAHVACAIWIPEVSIGSVEKMEPITKISAIPPSRWSLICVICKEKTGACIQCSVKTCKTAYHVTCAFKSGLEMKPIIVDENAEDGIKLRSYCEKHSVNTKKDKTAHSGSEDDGEKKKSRSMTAEERNQARAEKLQQIEAEFFKYVRLKDVSQNLAVDMDIVNLIYNYWKLKRKSLNNRPLVPPRPETTQLLTQQQEQDLEQMKMFVQLRQDLERVRNLCYMVSRREKLSRSYFRLREQAFQKQVAILGDKGVEGLTGSERAAILEANHGPSVYDQVYSQSGTKCNYKDFQSLVTLIGGDARPELVNGLVKPKGSKTKGSVENPYKKTFVNGARRRSESLSSLSETEVIGVKGSGGGGQGTSSVTAKQVRKPLAYLFDTDSSMDVAIMSNTTKTKTLLKPKVKKGGKSKQAATKAAAAAAAAASSSESELELLPSPVKVKGRPSISGRQKPIYSDTESDTASTTKLPKKLSLAAAAAAASASSHMVTKGALKEFSKKGSKNVPIPSQQIPQLPITKSTIRVSPLLSKGEDPPPPPLLPPPTAVAKKRGRLPGKNKKVDPFEATELIVPQREAAKKATESIKSVKNVKGKEPDGGTVDAPVAPPPAPPPPQKEVKVENKEGGEKGPNRRKSSVGEVIQGRRKSSVVVTEEKRVNRRVTVPEVEVPAPPPRVEKRGSVVVLSDADSDGGGAVSIVPQRQAAKKAAEHIRSCQSNVVAARLIIEDEMEASRKKSKMERAKESGKGVKNTTEKSPTRGRPPSVSATLTSQAAMAQGRDLVSTDSVVGDRRVSAVKVPGVKEKSPVKGNPPPHGTSKLGRKDSGTKSPVKEELKNVDWPFLDKGSQSACRRSRERSSSSSSTSSGSTSTSDSSSYNSSSSSSRSSSPGSASPVRSKASPQRPSPIHLPTLVPLSTSGPGKKLKTSERLPTTSRNGTEPSSPPPRGRAPPPKATGPPKSGPRRGTAPILRPSSPGPPIRSRGTASVSPVKRQSKGELNTSDPVPKSTEEKRDAIEGKPGLKEEKNISKDICPPGKKTPLIRDELALSSDSEEAEIKPKEEGITVKPRGRTQSRSSISHISPELKNRPMPKTKKRELGLLSEDSGSADEKENEMKVLEPSPTPAADSPRKAQIPTVPVPLPALLSPLASRCLSPLPQREPPPPKLLSPLPQKVPPPPRCLSPLPSEKEKKPVTQTELQVHTHPLAQAHPQAQTHSQVQSHPQAQAQMTHKLEAEAEPEAKRPRIESPPPAPQQAPPPPLSPPPSLSIPVQSFAGMPTVPGVGSAVTSAPSMPKSIFSPVATQGSKPADLLDFDNDLYDLARSVTVDYGRDSTEGQGNKKESLSFSFSQALTREDNKEESAQATINLVEKLRLQQKQKSGGPQKPELEGPTDFEDITSEEPPPPPPPPPLTIQVPVPVSVSAPIIEQFFPNRIQTVELEDETVCDLTKSPPKIPVTTARSTPPDLPKFVEEDRWLQNNFSHVLPPVSTAHAHAHLFTGKMGHPEPLPKDDGRFHQNSPKLMPLHNQNFHSPQILQGQGQLLPGQGQSQLLQGQGQNQLLQQGQGPSQLMKEEANGSALGLLMQPKESIDRLMSLQSHHLGLLMEAPCSNNLVSMTVNSSPTLPPGISLPPGLTATYTGTVPPPPPTPYQSTHPGFLPYPINSTLANVVTSLSSGNLPFFHSQSHLGGKSKLSISTPLSSPPVVSNSYALGFAHHFANLAPQPQLGIPGSMDPPRHSPSERRRSSESNSLAVVTSGMPPLSKPPLTSPSLLLASNNTMAAPPPPPQSTVAQIIESVIQASNNHPHNSLSNHNMHQMKPTFPTNSSMEMNFQFRMNQYQKMLSSPTNSCTNLSSNNSPLVSPTLTTVKTLSAPPPSSPPHPTVSDFSAILSNKTNENIQPAQAQKLAGTRDYVPPMVTAAQGLAVSPKGAGAGRGRRPTTPKVKVDKVLVAEETSPKGRGKGERKASGASPGRGAKGSTTPRRGVGRGKAKGKNVLVRKDLAGTVYDIDLDEFEENTEDKFDLRSLRDRRKSNDVNSGDRKSEDSEESEPLPRAEKNSPRQQKANVTSCENEIAGQTGRQRSSSGLQSSLLAPVDMRTFSAGPVDLDPYGGHTNFDTRKSSSAIEFASLMSSSNSTAAMASVRDFEELDKTLEALTSPVKANLSSTGITDVPPTVNHVVHPKNSTSQNLASSLGGPGGESSLSSSKDSFTTTFSEDNHSRNQLKVKIKGPFLDANYSSSNSITQPTYQQTSTHLHHHEPLFGNINSTPTMMNNPLNLRRMRKKELLRQYCNQDMNMDGRYTNPSGGDYPHSHFHPYGRAVITIPKAVASMEIIPSGKDDYGLEPSDLCPLPTPPPIPVQEKKKRSRGVNREMAALGLIDPPKGDRWRGVGDFLGGPLETNSRKRVRAAAKPSRSTFVPPTLADAGNESGSTVPPPLKSTLSLTAVNHPTPKLKIKFADFNSSTATCSTTGGTGQVDSNHVSDKDSKKAKGRPPKKRGIAEVATPLPPPPMEELKRQSLMFREKIMKDFANADDERVKSGGKKKKKSKKSRRNNGDDDDLISKTESSQVKIITEAGGPKLILRFGKNRTTTSGVTDTLLNNNNIDGGTKKENGPDPPPVSLESTEKVGGGAGGEQDSGFTGSSEGSGCSWTPSVSLKTKFSAVLRTSTSPKPNHRKSEDGGGTGTGTPPSGILRSNEGQGGGESGIDSAVLKFKPTTADVGVIPSTSNSVTPTTPTSPTLAKGPKDKVMPIRLKLHRCYEGYATTKEVDRENTNPKQSDSCEVR